MLLLTCRRNFPSTTECLLGDVGEAVLSTLIQMKTVSKSMDFKFHLPRYYMTHENFINKTMEKAMPADR